MIWDLLKLSTVGCIFFIVVHITWDYVIFRFVVQIKTEIEIVIQFAYSSRLLAIPSPDHWSAIEFQILSKFFSYRIYSCRSRPHSRINRPPFSRSKIGFLIISGKQINEIHTNRNFPKRQPFLPENVLKTRWIKKSWGLIIHGEVYQDHDLTSTYKFLVKCDASCRSGLSPE